MTVSRQSSRPDPYAHDVPTPAHHLRFGIADREPGLCDERAAPAVLAALRERHGRTAEILAYCVMPDHVHLLVALRGEGRSLPRWVAGFKRRLTNQLGVRWQPGFYRHTLDTADQVRGIAAYILDHPVREGLERSWRRRPCCGSLAWDL